MQALKITVLTLGSGPLEDEDVLSDGGEEYVSPEHQGAPFLALLLSRLTAAARLNDGLDQVREIVGGPDVSGLSDEQIKDVLWDYEFDIEETTQWAIGV